MTFTETLQLKEKYLQYEDLRALAYCEKRWQQDGRPTKRWELVNFLERMLQELKTSGTGYPKVLLLRKKQIQRRTFIPAEPGDKSTTAQDMCSTCKGSGWRATNPADRTSSYIPCTCKAGTANAAIIFSPKKSL